jgi:RNA polymerase sigma-70 factor (ECF subfamily)
MEQNLFSSSLLGRTAQVQLKVKPPESAFNDSDDIIINAVCEGDTQKFEKLVIKYQDFVFTLVYNIVKSEESAKDVVQEVFLRVYRSIRRFERKSSFKTWLYRIAYNTALAHKKREKPVIALEDRFIQDSDSKLFKDHALKLTLEKLIAKLKPELKAVILFHYYDDLKYEEIAEILDCPLGTVKIRLYRAKFELKKLWNRYAI